MDAVQLKALAKVQKCLNLAADTRGDPTTRETAWRQAQVLIEKHGLQLDKFEPAQPPAQPAIPTVSSPDWGPYWAQRSAADAMRAGVRTTVLCADGWHVPG